MGITLEDEITYRFTACDHELGADSYRRQYVQLAPQLTTLLPGATSAFDAVRQSGERAVVITAKHPVSVEPSLKAVELQPDEVFSHVHAPEKAAVLVQIRAAASVGDTPADMNAAVTSG